MCFHNSLSTDAQKLENRYQAEFNQRNQFQSVYHASAFQNIIWPVITNNQQQHIQLFSWGLIPHWTKNILQAEEIRQLTYNARLETMFQKRSFAVAASSKRCLVPSTGFYEWQMNGKMKIPWFIRAADQEIFSLAGIWDTWTDENSGKEIYTFSIVTTEAVGIMEKIHNTKKRMPLLLTKENETLWLSANSMQENYKFVISSGFMELKAHTVSDLIGSKTKNSNIPDVQQEFHHFVNGLLFE